MVSVVQRRMSKGCLVQVEGTWFDDLGKLSELSGITDDVTGHRFGKDSSRSGCNKRS